MSLLSEVNNNTDDVSSRLTPTWVANEYVSITFVAVFVPFIFFSNVMVIVSVAKYKRLQIPTNLFFTSLATADIVIAIALPVYVAVELTPLQVGNVTSCLAVNRILMTAGGVSILTLAIVAYDRYTAITYPLKYMLLMKRRKILGLILCSWLYSGIVCWIPIIFDWHGHISDDPLLCTNRVLDRKSRILFICAIFTPACAFILFFYFKIFRIARHHAKAIAAIENSIRNTLERQFVKSDTKYAKTIAIVIGVFLCLWLPYQICLLLTFIGYSEQNQWVNNYLMLLAFFNSGVNPWVYANQNSDFRSAYKEFWDTLKCRRIADIEDRRTSIISTVSQIHGTSSSARLNRANSRVVASDILYTLSQQMGNASIEYALNRRLSAKHSVIMAVNSLPDLLKLYASSDTTSTNVDINKLEKVVEEDKKSDDKVDGNFQREITSKDSAYPSSELSHIEISNGT